MALVYTYTMPFRSQNHSKHFANSLSSFALVSFVCRHLLCILTWPWDHLLLKYAHPKKRYFRLLTLIGSCSNTAFGPSYLDVALFSLSCHFLCPAKKFAT